MFDKIKENRGRRKLAKKLKLQHRKPKLKNLDEVMSVAILYSADERLTYDIVKNYVKFLKEEGVKSILVLGYCSLKEIPDYLQPKLEFDYFTKKELNMYLEPSGTAVSNFVATQFDVLIDLTTEFNLPLRNVLFQSKARLKIGKYNESDEQHYDFMINSGQQDLAKFIEQVTYYLAVLNKSK